MYRNYNNNTVSAGVRERSICPETKQAHFWLCGEIIAKYYPELWLGECKLGEEQHVCKTCKQSKIVNFDSKIEQDEEPEPKED